MIKLLFCSWKFSPFIYFFYSFGCVSLVIFKLMWLRINSYVFIFILLTRNLFQCWGMKCLWLVSAKESDLLSAASTANGEMNILLSLTATVTENIDKTTKSNALKAWTDRWMEPVRCVYVRCDIQWWYIRKLKTKIEENDKPLAPFGQLNVQSKTTGLYNHHTRIKIISTHECKRKTKTKSKRNGICTHYSRLKTRVILRNDENRKKLCKNERKIE